MAFNEKVLRSIADAMVASGMKEVGYQYVVIADCWQNARDSAGFIIADAQSAQLQALKNYSMEVYSSFFLNSIGSLFISANLYLVFAPLTVRHQVLKFVPS